MQWPHNNRIPLQKLARKTALLVMLASMRRQRELRMLRLDCSTLTQSSLAFDLIEPVKNYNQQTFRNNKSLQKIVISALPEEPRLCPVRAVREYVDRTKTIRQTQALFIINTPPFTAISANTLSRWLKQEL